MKSLQKDNSEKVRPLRPSFLELLREDWLIFLGTALAAGVLFWILRNVGLATHDDINTYHTMRFTSVKELFSTMFNWMPRGKIAFVFLPVNLTLHGVFQPGNFFWYKAAFYLPIVLNVCFLGYMIGKRFGRYLGYAVVLLIFALIRNDGGHNLLVAYPIAFQLGFLFFLGSMELLLCHKESRGNWVCLAGSAVLLTLSFFYFESFVTYTALALAVILYFNHGKTGRWWNKETVFDFLPYFCGVALFLVFYRLTAHLMPATYSGASVTVSSAFHIWDFIKADFQLTTGLFPLFVFLSSGDTLREFFIQFFRTPLPVFLKAIAVALVWFLVMKKAGPVRRQTAQFLCVFALAAAFLFTAPLALTPKYQQWVNAGVRTYTAPSFFGFFWIALVAAVLLLYFRDHVKRKKLYLWVSCGFLFFASLMTDFSNTQVARGQAADQARYSAFDRLVSGNYFKGVPEGSVIYTDTYVGLHLKIDWLSTYARSYTGKDYDFTRNTNELWNPSQQTPRYFLRYDSEGRYIMLCRLARGMTAEECYISAAKSESGIVLAMERENDSKAAVRINAKNMGDFGQWAVLPVEIGPDGLLLQSRAMKADGVRLLKAWNPEL